MPTFSTHVPIARLDLSPRNIPSLCIQLRLHKPSVLNPTSWYPANPLLWVLISVRLCTVCSPFCIVRAVQVKKDFQEAVLSYRQDEFFRKNMYANFGDIGSAVKELVDEFQKQTSNTKRINTIEDMQVGSLLPPCLQCSSTLWLTANSHAFNIRCAGRTCSDTH